jgi:hypothetical protein
LPKLVDWVNKAITERLVHRFEIGEVPNVPNPYLLMRVIVPTTQFDDLLAVSELASVAKDISAAAGTFVIFHTVPLGKRWKLLFSVLDATSAASRIALYDGTVEISLTAQSTTLKQDKWSRDFVLEEGWSLGAYTTGNGGDTARSMQIWYVEEDSYKTLG